MTIDGHTLSVDGSTYEGSVAVLRGAKLLAERTLKDEDGGAPRAGRGEKLMPAIVECLREAKLGPDGIARIVCGSGPGSFTSLRVAASVAKGLAAGLGVELYAVSSLALSVTGTQPPLPSGEYLSVLDAMRGEFYAVRVTKPQLSPTGTRRIDITGRELTVDFAVHSLEVSAPTITTRAELDEMLTRSHPLKVIGPGQEIDAHPHARGVGPILEWICQQGPVDLSSWEPDYGRLAEAQVRWEATHGRKLTT